MTNKRENDSRTQPHFRSDRIVKEDGQWFFYTREGTVEGPFKDEMEASAQVELYIKVMASNILSAYSELSVERLIQAG